MRVLVGLLPLAQPRRVLVQRARARVAGCALRKQQLPAAARRAALRRAAVPQPLPRAERQASLAAVSAPAEAPVADALAAEPDIDAETLELLEWPALCAQVRAHGAAASAQRRGERASTS
jgi:hypothetical protein